MQYLHYIQFLRSNKFFGIMYSIYMVYQCQPKMKEIQMCTFDLR